MAVEPTTILNLPMQALRNLIAACPTFQAWTGTGGYAGAKGRVRYIGSTDQATVLGWEKPYAVIDEGDDGSAGELIGEPNTFAQSGELLIIFFDDVDTEQTTEADQVMTFGNVVGAIFEEMIARRGSHESGESLLVFDSFTYSGPMIAHKDRRPGSPRFVQAFFNLRYGESPA